MNKDTRKVSIVCVLTFNPVYWVDQHIPILIPNEILRLMMVAYTFQVHNNNIYQKHIKLKYLGRLIYYIIKHK